MDECAKLTDADLVRAVRFLAERARHNEIRLLAHLSEFDARRLCLKKAIVLFSSTAPGHWASMSMSPIAESERRELFADIRRQKPRWKEGKSASPHWSCSLRG